MSTVGIIAEFNPYHNGHSYLIKEAVRTLQKETGETPGVIIMMSGNFVQRGAPAILDKYTRAAAALEDADLVFEIPVLWAANDAGHFASCGINMLSQMKTDYIAFGIETIKSDDSEDSMTLEKTVSDLKCVSKILSEENEDYKIILKSELASGLSYPSARANALNKYMGIDVRTISSPNNILAIEYLTAINKLRSDIRPVFIERKGAAYNDTEMYSGYSSATAIRKVMTERNPDTGILKSNLPADQFEIISGLIRDGYPFIEEPDIMPYIISQLKSRSNEELLSIMGMNRELLNRISKANLPMSYGELVDYMKTKNITHTRITRLLVQIALHITKNEFIDNYEFPEYANLLAMRKSASGIIKNIRENSDITIIDKKSVFQPVNDISILSRSMDCRASDIYNEIIFLKSGLRLPSELKSTVIVK